MERIEAGATGGLVVACLDRFGHPVQDSANLLARIRSADGALCTVAEGIDTSGYMAEGTGLLSGALRCGGCSYAMKLEDGKNAPRQWVPRIQLQARQGGRRCPAPASVKPSVIEPFALAYLFAFAKSATARTQEEDSSNLDAEVAAAEAERGAALDERLAEALGGSESDVYLRTVENRHARVDALLEECAERDQGREPAEFGANLEQVWEDLTPRRSAPSTSLSFRFGFRLADSDSGAQPRLPIAERARLFLAGEGPPVPVRGQRGTIRTLPVDGPAPAEAP